MTQKEYNLRDGKMMRIESAENTTNVVIDVRNSDESFGKISYMTFSGVDEGLLEQLQDLEVVDIEFHDGHMLLTVRRREGRKSHQDQVAVGYECLKLI